MALSDCFVSVIAPLHNDADIVESYVTEMLGVLRHQYENYELVLIDDGSRDATVEKASAMLAEHECIRLIRLSRQFGLEAAISAGLDSVIGDYVVVMMPETDPPEMIPDLVQRCRSGIGIVYGVRKRRGDPLLVRWGARVFYWYFHRVLKIHLPKDSTDFRVYSRQTVNAITRIKDRLRYLRTLPDYVGYGNEGFTYDPVYRRSRPRARGLGECVRLAVSMVAANTTHPLWFLSGLGVLLSLLSILYSGYVVLAYLFGDNLPAGWAASSLQSSIMFLVLFLILTAQSVYLDRLLGEVRERPLYYVLDEQNSSVLIADEMRKNVVTESRETPGAERRKSLRPART